MQRSATAREHAHAGARAGAPPRSDFQFDASLVPASAQSVGLAGRVRKGFKGWLKGAVITLSVMYVVPFFVLSFAVASVDSIVWSPTRMTGTVEKSIAADRVRAFGLRVDPTITPDQAGLAFAGLQPSNTGFGEFTPRRGVHFPVVPWRNWTFPGTLFPTARPTSWTGPDAAKILLAVKAGFSAEEKAVLRVIGTAPAWREYDTFAQAGAADIIGGLFQLPFRSDATIYAMPFSRFAATKEMAYASVSRAAWHLSEGRRDSAVFALRATISFGHVMADHSPFIIDQLIGNVVTGIGRTALGQLYTITGDPRGAELDAAAPAQKSAGRFYGALPREIREINEGTLAEKRERLITIATTPSFSQPVRTEALRSLALSSCTNIGELLMGPNASVRAAFDKARDLARYPSERAVVDLIENSLNRTPPPTGARDPLNFAMWAEVGARIYFFNPRLSTCAVMATQAGTAP